MAENIFEELLEETEKILGGPLKGKVMVEGLNFRFQDFKKKNIRMAFQETVNCVIKNVGLKGFVFKNIEVDELYSLTSTILRLVLAGKSSTISSCSNDLEHFLECPSCQMKLFLTVEYFTSKLMKISLPDLLEKDRKKKLRQSIGRVLEFFGLGASLGWLIAKTFPEFRFMGVIFVLMVIIGRLMNDIPDLKRNWGKE